MAQDKQENIDFLLNSSIMKLMVLHLTPLCIKCFQTLAVHSRFLIFQYLKSHYKYVTVTKLVKYIGLTQPTITFHLNKLMEVGIVAKEKVGRKVFCKINKRCENCTIFK